MQKRENFIPFFLVFLGLSLSLIFIGKSGAITAISSLVNKSVNPAKALSLGIFSFGPFQNKAIKNLSDENSKLRKEAGESKNMMMDNKALRDQFAVTSIRSQELLPAKVVGYPGFIPGVTLPEYLIIDKGGNENIRKGSSVVVGEYLVGRVVEINSDFSKVELLINKNSSFTGKVMLTDGKDISGIVKGKGNDEMIFENVLLTSTIKNGDEVMTKGERNEKGVGYPPDIIVGKIISVEKKSSDLFQKAAIKSAVDFSSLKMVFVIR